MFASLLASALMGLRNTWNEKVEGIKSEASTPMMRSGKKPVLDNNSIKILGVNLGNNSGNNLGNN